MVNHLTNPLSDRPPPLGNLLAAASRRLAAELDAGTAAAGFPDLRAAHAPLFQVIDPGGTRLTDLAARAGTTKQAMGETVKYLARHGYVEVAADPADRRARLVTLTEKGWGALKAGVAIIETFDRTLDELLGAAEVERLRTTLLAIIGGAGSTASHGTEDTAVMRS